MADKNEEWYTSKDLLEKINDVMLELNETKHLIKKYNGLYEKVENVTDEVKTVRFDVNEIKNLQKGKQNHTTNLYQLSGWIFGLFSILILIGSTFF